MGLINVDKVLTELTLHEKIELLSGHDTWRTKAIERLNIPAITVCTCHQPINRYILTCRPHNRRPMDPTVPEAPRFSMAYELSNQALCRCLLLLLLLLTDPYSIAAGDAPSICYCNGSHI
jgi:hypothetical protein